MSARIFKNAQELLTFDSALDVVEVARPAGGVLRSASSKPLKLNSQRRRKTIFIPQDNEPFEIRLDTNLLDVSGRGMFSLCNFDWYGSPHFEGITDVDLVSPRFTWNYAEMHRSARMRTIYNDRARALYLQSARRVNVYTPDMGACQSGITVSKSHDVTIAGGLWPTQFGGPTTTAVHPDAVGIVGGGTERLHVVDSLMMHYPRFVFQGGSHHDFLFNNLWMAANVLPLQFFTDASDTITGKLKNLYIWFTGKTRYYRVDNDNYRRNPLDDVPHRAGIDIEQKNINIEPDMPGGPPAHVEWWEWDQLELARMLVTV